MKSVAVIGLGFGDEGKGLVTNWLAQHNQFETNTRFSGGYQVGHTVVTDEFRHVFQNFGSATASGIATVWSKDYCIDPIKIKREYEQLKKFDLSPKIYIHEECAVITPYDVISSINEAGIRETFKRELNGCHFQAKHLTLPAVLEGKLRGLSNYYKIFESMIEIIDTFKEVVQFILDSEDILIVPQHVFNDFDKIPSIYEGSQGLLLDEKIGFYPNVTWENLLPPKDIDVFMVTRAYKTRHGSGFFNDKKITEHINIPSTETNIFDPYQGDFRYDILDLDLLQYSASHIPLAHRNLVITCLDHIDEYVYIYKGIPNMCNSKQRFLEDIASVVGVNSAYYSESPYSEKIKRFI